MGVLQVLNAHKSFLENVQNLGILKKKAVVSSGLQDKPLNVVLEKWGVAVICKAKAFRTTWVPGRSESPWHICLSCTVIRIVSIWRAKTSQINWKSWQIWTSLTSGEPNYHRSPENPDKPGHLGHPAESSEAGQPSHLRSPEYSDKPGRLGHPSESSAAGEPRLLSTILSTVSERSYC